MVGIMQSWATSVVRCDRVLCIRFKSVEIQLKATIRIKTIWNTNESAKTIRQNFAHFLRLFLLIPELLRLKRTLFANIKFHQLTWVSNITTKLITELNKMHRSISGQVIQQKVTGNSTNLGLRSCLKFLSMLSSWVYMVFYFLAFWIGFEIKISRVCMGGPFSLST